jgi:hypothetical protein
MQAMAGGIKFRMLDVGLPRTLSGTELRFFDASPIIAT